MKYQTVLEAAQAYLEHRRKLGFALKIEGAELCRFARYTDKIGHRGPITTDLAVQWAKLTQNCHSINSARRFEIVRRFAKYMKLTVPETEVPPKGLLGPAYRRRPTPHIYPEEEIAAIMRAAKSLTPINGLRPHTYATLFGLLACSGMRISEALRLSREDVDLRSGTITIIESKFHKSRIIPLHSTTLNVLKSYIDKRDRRHPFPQTKAFFVSEKGTSLKYGKVLKTFREIVFSFGWRNQTGDRGPRIHDLRHTFAVHRLIEWCRCGEDVHQKISALSTYLGHVKVTDTYWYLTAVPELMAIAAARFEQFACKGGAI
ncbi:MAG: tyrosine-type recombinase/integrase [Candidatus Brocadiales bacterium]|nr:tyrosine-type recombinase/integrase [Candidatus Brocadiales bacterium]